MKKIVILTFLFTIMMLPSSAKAITCDYTYKAELRKRAANVMPSYTYEEKNDTVTFTITLTNISSDLYVTQTITDDSKIYIDPEEKIKRYYPNKNNEIVLTGFKAGQKVKLDIYLNATDCIVYSLTTKYVNLPYYNKYYKDPLCEGKENYSVCYKWNKGNMTQEEFEKRVKELYNEQPKKEETKEEEETLFDKIYDFLHEYYIFILGGIAVIMIAIMLLRRKKDDFEF